MSSAYLLSKTYSLALLGIFHLRITRNIIGSNNVARCIPTTMHEILQKNGLEYRLNESNSQPLKFANGNRTVCSVASTCYAVYKQKEENKQYQAL